MDKILSMIEKTSDPDSLWNDVRARLLSEGITLREERQIRQHWTAYEVQRMDATNDVLQKLRAEIIRWCGEIIRDKPNTKLRYLINDVWLRVQALNLSNYPKEYIFAMSMLELYENI